MKLIKILIIIFFSMIILIIGGVIYWLFEFANTTECNETSIYQAKNYKISENKCLGWAGPPWSSYKLFYNNDIIETDSIDNDSCIIIFYTSATQYHYNKCSEEFQVLKLWFNLNSRVQTLPLFFPSYIFSYDFGK